MNYDYDYEIDCFYTWNMSNALGTSCIVLWFALMHTWRSLGYPSTFTVTIPVLSVKTGLQKGAIQRARNTLQQNGRITWAERKGNQCAKYTINSFAVFKRPQNESQTNPQTSPQSSPQCEPIINNNNDINNKDKKDVVVSNNAVFKRPQNESQIEPQIKPQNFKSIQKYYEQYLGNLLSTTAYMKILEYLESGIEEALICKAIDKSIDSGARNWIYAERVIDSCVLKGILTLEQYELGEANRKSSKKRLGESGNGISNSNGKQYGVTL